MANNVSTFAAHKILDKVFGATDFTPPATFYVGLMSVRPLVDGTGGTEFSGNGYARVAVTNNTTNFPNASARTKSNGTTITFPTATGNQGTAVAVVLYDAPTGGNLWFISNTVSIAVTNGMTPYFAVGDLTFPYA